MLDESAQTLFLTEMMRGLNLTLKAFFDQKVTVSITVACLHPLSGREQQIKAQELCKRYSIQGAPADRHAPIFCAYIQIM